MSSSPTTPASAELQKKLCHALSAKPKESNLLEHWPSIVECMEQGAHLSQPVEPGEKDFTPLHVAADVASTTLWKNLWHYYGPFDLEVTEPSEKLTPALCAAESGNTASLSFLLAQGANPNAKSSSGEGILLKALESRSMRCMDVALKAAPSQALDLRADGLHFFEACVVNNLPDFVSTLLSMEQKPAELNAEFLIKGQRAIVLAAEAGADASIRALAYHGADVKAQKTDPLSPMAAAAGSQAAYAKATMTLLELGATMDEPVYPSMAPGAPEASLKVSDEAFIDSLDNTATKQFLRGHLSLLEASVQIASHPASRLEALRVKLDAREAQMDAKAQKALSESFSNATPTSHSEPEDPLKNDPTYQSPEGTSFKRRR